MRWLAWSWTTNAVLWTVNIFIVWPHLTSFGLLFPIFMMPALCALLALHNFEDAEG